MKLQKKIPFFLYFLTALLSASIFAAASAPALAAPKETKDELEQAAKERLLLPVQSNSLAYWPTGPAITAQSAILMEAETGTVLYAKNTHEKL